MFHKEIQKLIDHLEMVRRRPLLYVSAISYEALRDHLAGIYIASEIFGFKWDFSTYGQVELERGWDNNNALGSLPHMRESGLSEAEIFEEVLEMWITALEHMRDNLQCSSDND